VEYTWSAAGPTGLPLTPAGVAHAHRIGELLADYGIDGVFTSPLGRALTTATICATRLRLPVVTVPSLTEVDHGAWAGLTDQEIARRYPEQHGHRSTDKYRFQFPGGESYADADTRAIAALAAIAGHRVSRPLVVSHEMIGRLLRRHLLGLTPQEACAGSTLTVSSAASTAADRQESASITRGASKRAPDPQERERIIPGPPGKRPDGYARAAATARWHPTRFFNRV
jgi:broad specificity phosphatase PhoE